MTGEHHPYLLSDHCTETCRHLVYLLKESGREPQIPDRWLDMLVWLYRHNRGESPVELAVQIMAGAFPGLD